MRSRRRSMPFVALVAALALVAASCGGAEETPPGGGSEQPQTGGTLIFGAEQEPAILNTMLTAGNLAWGAYTVRTPIFHGAYQIQPDFSMKPMLVESADVQEDPFAVTYHIHEDATWSDGEPVSADDFIFTWETIMNKDWDITSRSGYDLITEAEKIDEKSVKFTFEQTFAPWQQLFSGSDYVLPKHALEGENFNKVWSDTIVNPKTGEPIGSGPFLFKEWKKGSQLTIQRNENYWGEHTAYLDEVVFRFVTDTNTEIQALRGQEVDMIYPQPQLALTELNNVPGVANDVDSGPIWQHLDFQFKNDLLGQDFVRQAIAHAIDREAIVERLVRKLQPDAEPLHNLIYVNNQEEYEPHFDKWNYDPATAQSILDENGCTKGGDGIYECDGERLSFGYVSTSGNELRELMFQIIQSNLKDAGIEVRNDFGEADVVFGKVLASGDWDMFQFAWVGSPDPFSGNSIWLCDGDQNYNAYCNEEVTRLINETNRLVDSAERATTYNEADAAMAEDLPVLPLWQMPQPWYYYDKVKGLENNATQEGPTWNIVDWWIEQ